ncbi:hypothetical protein [Bradyrhizobium septentrionale]|uniref:Uncharacterized protein n=1 Tax=Bradyrhizobium septentrionale TaxID=1404411 RepID=A0A973W181_9BRAD|nr:hypothetical protein [Bradyrhizobium septentrionale]UGY14099.1 hypothetical protein HAP48_0036885 [Bradyrhizobium septentrionale]UGY22654.1 hypothetical protein HU675_0032385 [Bradyrhizobium septentrionale]
MNVRTSCRSACGAARATGKRCGDKTGQQVPAIEAAWGVNGVQGSAWLNLILSGYCE